jgi:hypothetical protein
MTQSPYGGSASQPMQSTAGPNAAQTTSSNGGRNGSGGSGAGSGSKSSTNDFGATTISGSPRQPGAAQQQQHSSVATEQRTAGNSPTSPGGQTLGQQGNYNRPPSPSPSTGRGARNRGPRRARLQLRHISPLTVLKFSCVLAIALFFVWLIIVGVLYGVLDAAGVIQKVNDTVVQLNGSGSKPPITAGIVFGGAAIVGVINIVLFVALTTIGSVIYNLCADLVGGIEITLSER